MVNRCFLVKASCIIPVSGHTSKIVPEILSVQQIALTMVYYAAVVVFIWCSPYGGIHSCRVPLYLVANTLCIVEMVCNNVCDRYGVIRCVATSGVAVHLFEQWAWLMASFVSTYAR